MLLKAIATMMWGHQPVSTPIERKFHESADASEVEEHLGHVAFQAILGSRIRGFNPVVSNPDTNVPIYIRIMIVKDEGEGNGPENQRLNKPV